MYDAGTEKMKWMKQDQDEEWEGALTVSNSLESIHHFWEYLQAAVDLATDIDILYFIMLNHIQSEGCNIINNDIQDLLCWEQLFCNVQIIYHSLQLVSACLSLSQLGQMICDSFGILMLMPDIFHIVNHKNVYWYFLLVRRDWDLGVKTRNKAESDQDNNIKWNLYSTGGVV